MKDIKRICDFYKKFKKEWDHDSMWTNIITTMNEDNLNIFLTIDYPKCKYLLEHISEFDNITYGYDPAGGSDKFHSCLKTSTKEVIIKMLEEMNISPIYLNNELDIENLLPLLDEKCGFRIEFLEYFDYENRYDILSSRGKISHRNMFALYYVYNISKNVIDVKNASVLEIGAGAGRTAYWAYKFGFKKYTIIDIINTGIIQAHYNFCLLGPDNVVLSGEDESSEYFLKIINNTEYDTLHEKFDIIANFDGLTEYGRETAQNYFDKFHLLSNKFISINHTINPYRVSELYKDRPNIKVDCKEECNYRADHSILKYIKEVISFHSHD